MRRLVDGEAVIIQRETPIRVADTDQKPEIDLPISRPATSIEMSVPTPRGAVR